MLVIDHPSYELQNDTTYIQNLHDALNRQLWYPYSPPQGNAFELSNLSFQDLSTKKIN